jgi:hypothetical protein
MDGRSLREIHYKRAILFLVFQIIDPPSPSPPGEWVPPAFVAGGGQTRQAERGMGGGIFWKTREIGLPSYNDLSTAGRF